MSKVEVGRRYELGRNRPSSAPELGRQKIAERLGLAVDLVGGNTAAGRVCECSEGTVRNWKKGESEPGLTALVRLADAAGVSVEWLAAGRAPEPVGGPRAAETSAAYAASDGDFAMVPRFDVSASAGNGALVGSETVLETIAFRRDWLSAEGLAPEKLAVLTVRGDSMAPTLEHGDTLLIDLRTADAPADGLWVISWDGALAVKRVQLLVAGGMRIVSDSPRYQPQDLAPEAAAAVRLVGRVVWIGRRI